MQMPKAERQALYQIFDVCFDLARDRFELRDIARQVATLVEKYLVEEEKAQLRNRYNMKLIKLPERFKNGRISE